MVKNKTYSLFSVCGNGQSDYFGLEVGSVQISLSSLPC